MEFLRIGENQLKITLSEDELLFYGLDLSSLNYSSTETRRAFWALLDDAKHATGFDAAASKVSVQIYASKDGGCEMYISAEEHSDCLSVSPPAESSPLPMESGLTVCPSVPRHFSSAVGAFNRLGDLLSACRALGARGYSGNSSAWQINDRYYLHLGGASASRKSGKNSPDGTDLLWEFALPAGEITLPYLAEHGISLCAENAVATLGRIAT